MKNPCTLRITDNQLPFSTPAVSGSQISFIHTAQGWITDFTGTLPFPILFEGAAGSTSTFFKETAKEDR